MASYIRLLLHKFQNGEGKAFWGHTPNRVIIYLQLMSFEEWTVTIFSGETDADG